jgi:hypothetical protein
MKEEAPLGNPFIGEPRGGRPAKDGGWAASPCGQSPSILSQRCGGRAKEGDSGGEWRKGGRRWPTGHAWPPLNPYFHPALHLAPLMLTPQTKSIKSKANSFHPFLKFFLFIFEIL